MAPKGPLRRSAPFAVNKNFFLAKESSRTTKSILHDTSTPRVLCMADPERDSDFIYNEQGFVDILRSPFFDVNPEVDNSVEEYVELLLTSSTTYLFILIAYCSFKCHRITTSTIQWQITAKPRQGTGEQKSQNFTVSSNPFLGACLERTWPLFSVSP
ncbi:hypothetical protein M5K25_009434 [Dendrobium thyrsiflorum]|uniref:Uncharacterized protein n=1 Tax=Dendrobium thyrsiflorum TaxID=117978 RepID=A0ABD0V5J8_DENTH